MVPELLWRITITSIQDAAMLKCSLIWSRCCRFRKRYMLFHDWTLNHLLAIWLTNNMLASCVLVLFLAVPFTKQLGNLCECSCTWCYFSSWTWNEFKWTVHVKKRYKLINNELDNNKWQHQRACSTPDTVVHATLTFVLSSNHRSRTQVNRALLENFLGMQHTPDPSGTAHAMSLILRCKNKQCMSVYMLLLCRHGVNVICNRNQFKKLLQWRRLQHVSSYIQNSVWFRRFSADSDIDICFLKIYSNDQPILWSYC